MYVRISTHRSGNLLCMYIHMRVYMYSDVLPYQSLVNIVMLYKLTTFLLWFISSLVIRKRWKSNCQWRKAKRTDWTEARREEVGQVIDCAAIAKCILLNMYVVAMVHTYVIHTGIRACIYALLGCFVFVLKYFFVVYNTWW